MLDEPATLTSIERGSLFEEYRVKPSVVGAPPTRLGPYFKLQSWVNNKNLSTRILSIEVPLLRQDLKNGQRFSEITAALADMAIAESRANRKAFSPAAAAEAESLALAAKKLQQECLQERYRETEAFLAWLRSTKCRKSCHLSQAWFSGSG